MNPWMVSLVFISLLVKRGMTKERDFVLDDIVLGKLLSNTVLEGDNFYDICPSPGYPSDKVYWKNKANTFYSEGRELNITHISRAMSGLYTCYGKNNSVTVSLESYFIEVVYPAKILFWNISRNELYANESFVSIAGVEGKPPPSIYLMYTKQQKVIIVKHGEGIINLTISHLKCEDRGVYELRCSNTFNTEAMRKVLYVLCPPYVRPGANITFDNRPRLGESARFTMSAAGYPAPLFTWTHDGKEIKHEDSNYTSTVNLTVSSINEFGKYQLEMRNAVGSVLFTYHLIPAGPPERPKDLSLVSTTDNSATLSWIAGYDYNNTQTFVVLDFAGDRRDGTEMQAFDDSSTESGLNKITGTISYLKPNSLYNLTVKAVNKDGEAKSDKFVYFVTKDKGNSFPTPYIVSGSLGFCALIILAMFIRYRCRKGYEGLSNFDKTNVSQKMKRRTSYCSNDAHTNQLIHKSQSSKGYNNYSYNYYNSSDSLP